MAGPGSSSLLALLRDKEFISRDQWEGLSRISPPLENAALLRDLVRRTWLTPFQANRIAEGNAKDLILGPYRVFEPIGEGGMGQVFKARHVQMDRMVGLKVIPKEYLANANAVSRFYREVRAVAKLSHPNVVTAHDVGQEGDTHYFAMEFVEGIDLARLVKQSGPLPIAQACDFIRQAALGLQHANEKGLVHRDIKPGNIIVSRGNGAGPPVAKVLDFGLARFEDQSGQTKLTKLGSVLGTVDYISPEQAGDAREVDTRSDIFSLGCALFYVLTGKPPFQGATAMDRMVARCVREADSVRAGRAEVPPALERVLAKMLARNRADRYQSPAEVAAALEPFTRIDASGPLKRQNESRPPSISTAGRQAATAIKQARTASSSAVLPVVNKPSQRETKVAPSSEFETMAEGVGIIAGKPKRAAKGKQGGRSKSVIVVGLGLPILVGAIALWAGVFRSRTGNPEPAVPSQDSAKGEQAALNPKKMDGPPSKPDPMPPEPPFVITLSKEEQKKVDAAAALAAGFLKSRQFPDGSWTSDMKNHNVGYAALPGFALLECGVSAKDPTVEKAASFVRANCDMLDQTYELSLAILFLDRLGQQQDRKLIQRMALRLVGGQSNAGGWSYDCPLLSGPDEVVLMGHLQKTRPLAAQRGLVKKDKQDGNDGRHTPPGGFFRRDDNSNTQFAMLALWAARRHDVPTERTLAFAGKRFETSQNADGGWGYHALGPSGTHTTGSMTGAGLLALAMAHAIRDAGPGVAAADAAKKGQPALVRDGSIDKGLRALARFVPDADDSRHFNMYFLWTVERVALVYKLQAIGNKDWYRWGLQVLLANQQPDGKWFFGRYPGADATVDTCFALLFLKQSNLLGDLTRSLVLVENAPRGQLDAEGTEPKGKSGDKGPPAATADAAPEKPAIAGDKAFVTLFNGKDTSGWETVNSHRTEWAVRDGALFGKNIGPLGPINAGYLVLKQAFYQDSEI